MTSWDPVSDPEGPNNPRCACRHTRIQHGRDGCTWIDPTGPMNECKCKKKYNDFRR